MLIFIVPAMVVNGIEVVNEIEVLNRIGKLLNGI